jgi:preprotein translocase subunit SecD
VIVKKQVILTGENLTDAQPGFDQQTQQPKVDLTLDAKGGRIMRDVSRENSASAWPSCCSRRARARC